MFLGNCLCHMNSHLSHALPTPCSPESIDMLQTWTFASDSVLVLSLLPVLRMSKIEVLSVDAGDNPLSN